MLPRDMTCCQGSQIFWRSPVALQRVTRVPEGLFTAGYQQGQARHSIQFNTYFSASRLQSPRMMPPRLLETRRLMQAER